MRCGIEKRENRGIALFLANLANDFAFPRMGTVFGHRHALKSSGLAGWYGACLVRRFAGARSDHRAIIFPGRRTPATRRTRQSRALGFSSPPPEGRAVEAIADRIIPPGPANAGRKGLPDAPSISTANWPVPTGGRRASTTGHRFMTGTKQQGSAVRGRARRRQYRKGLAALDRYCRAKLCRQSLRRSRRQRQGRVFSSGLESDECQARRRRRQGVL